MTGSVLGVLCFGLAAFFAASGLIGAGLITRHRNTKEPSASTKRWGAAVSLLNLVQATAGAVIVVTLARRGTEKDVLVFLALGALLSLGVSVAGLIAAARARPA